jgi:serine/threonine protein kinase
MSEPHDNAPTIVAGAAPRTPEHNGRPSVGSRVASYRIEADIGSGGMANVFRALDERLGRQVALKVLIPELARDEAFRRRFVREARTAAAVDHPNIIPVFEAGNSDGVLFIAMRYVPGGDAQSLLEKSVRLPPEQVMEIVSPVASALDAAHKAGIIHRDVKPRNMLLDSRSDKSMHVYLTDFGITALLTDPAEDTATGMVIGTPNFMAPEQITGGSIDAQVDQYALATSAFVLLSGGLPFPDDGAGVATLMYAKTTRSAPPVTSRRPDLPGAVDDVFARALSISPARRFATCTQFAEALATALGGSEAKPDVSHKPTGPVSISLKRSFRYIHEPARAEDEVFASLGNDALMAQLEDRIQHSNGGTFLITGFRGVGKSTLVLRALDQIVARNSPSDLVLPVALSVARTTTTERLLFAIVRRIFEALSDSGVLERLPPQTRHALIVAYMRTSLAFKETQSEARERSAGVDLGIGPGKVMKAVADFAVPKVSMSAKRSHSLATEAAFLAYSETDVEYDLMRIVSLVARKPEQASGPSSLLRRLLQLWRSPDAGLPRLHLIIVLDEVDKLTADEAGLTTIEDLLSGVKNVLTMSGAHFLIVAGPDLHDRAIRDAARGNGVYESVFGWRLYVPCIWDASERLIADIVTDDPGHDPAELRLLANYLRFKARGMPRRLLQEINSFVTWDGDYPRLQIGSRDMERVEFYARLEGILQAYATGNGRRRLFPVAIDEDRWRLGGYYIVDWVLQSEGEPFTAAEVLKEEGEAKFDPLLRISRRNVDRLLDHLAKQGILEIVREVDASATIYADITESSEKVFCLTEEIRHQLYGFAARNESERAAREISLVPARAAAAPAAPPPPPPIADTAVYRPPAAGQAAAGTQQASQLTPVPAWGTPPPPASPAAAAPEPSALLDAPTFTGTILPPPRVVGGRYELGDLISQGGLSSLYKGRDIIAARPVLIRKLLSSLSQVPAAMARFRREAEIIRGLVHPQILRTYDVLDDPGDDPVIILEWVNGPDMQEMISRDGPMPPREVAAVGRVLAEALKYVADQGIVRLDLKPNNIVMADRGPVIRDLGIAFRVESDEPALTKTGDFVGTPAFMAPELLQGGKADPRADIYALGINLYYCLMGRNPWEDQLEQVAVVFAIIYHPLDLTVLPVSPAFRTALGQAIARNPDDRFPDAIAFRDALTETPEWRSVLNEARGDDPTRGDYRGLA